MYRLVEVTTNSDFEPVRFVSVDKRFGFFLKTEGRIPRLAPNFPIVLPGLPMQVVSSGFSEA
jgi:hypothetical protein